MSAGRVLLHQITGEGEDAAMFVESERQSERFAENAGRVWVGCARRPFRLAGLVAVGAGLLALPPALAHGATMFVHSARSGELRWPADAARRRPQRHLDHRRWTLGRRARRAGASPHVHAQGAGHRHAPRRRRTRRGRAQLQAEPSALQRLQADGQLPRQAARAVSGPRRCRSSRARRRPTASTATRFSATGRAQPSRSNPPPRSRPTPGTGAGSRP
jgi:hypothetical protein